MSTSDGSTSVSECTTGQIAALRKGIQKGWIENSDQTRIDLGVAYLRSGETQAGSRDLRRNEGGLRMARSRGAVVSARQ